MLLEMLRDYVSVCRVRFNQALHKSNNNIVFDHGIIKRNVSEIPSGYHGHLGRDNCVFHLFDQVLLKTPVIILFFFQA